jgi:dephospho-CoA kinase
MSRSIALIGPQGSGKSTIAEMFAEHRGYARHGIADAVKSVTWMAYPGLKKNEGHEVLTYSGARWLTGREIFQEVGAKMREIDRNWWMRIWEHAYDEIKSHGLSVVVDDVRLPSEIIYLRSVDPSIFVVRLFANQEVRRQRVGGQLLGTRDITELGWTDASFDISVDTSEQTPEETYRIITETMEETR